MRSDNSDPLLRDILGGVILGLTGIGVAIYAGVSLRMGRPSEMGPGFFPLVLGILITLFGGLIAVGALLRTESGDLSEKARPPFEWRPFVSILGAVALFALLARPFGLAPAIVVAVFAATALDEDVGWRAAAVLSAALCILSILVFRVLLGLHFEIFRWST